MNFTNPIRNGKINKSFTSKSISIETLPDSYIICPYDGEVVGYDDNKCDGRLTLKHFIDKEEYYSIICGIKNIPQKMFFQNAKVSKNETIGQSVGDSIEYSIENGRGKEQDVMYFFKKKDSSNINDKKDKETETKKTENQDKKTVKKDSNTLSNSLLKGMLFPFGVVSGFFDDEERERKSEERKKKEEEKKKKEEEEKKKKEENLNEEIKRIINLLK